MSALQKLKLVSFQADRRSPIVSRRNKLTAHLDSQIASAKAASDGGTFTAKRVKFIVDSETGERKPVEIAKRVKQWWFSAPTGKIMLELRYGAKRLEIVKGKNAVEVGSMDDLITALELIKAAVIGGELDAQIEQASGSLREGFTKKK